MASPTDQTSILTRVAAGDSSAVSECLDTYGPLVWSLARRMSFDASQAEDSVQEIFIEIWKSAHRFDASISSEVTFQIQDRAFDFLDAPIKRITAKDVPAPYAKNLIEYYMPQEEDAYQACLGVMYAK